MRSGIGRFTRAVATNQIARFAPSLYVRLTGQTGRGDAHLEDAVGIADYFLRCVDDYFDILGVAPQERERYLSSKRVLEYGPGDFPGVALLLVAMGARQVLCVDRFPLVRMSAKNVEVVHRLAASLGERERARLYGCFFEDAPESGVIVAEKVTYVVRPGGLCGLVDAVELVVSRAVLEHVADLDATFDDMLCAMRPGARAAHLVDLRSHGLHRSNPLDFLDWPDRVWSLMYSHKGVPNRWRIDRYRQLVASLPCHDVQLITTARARPEDVAAVRATADPAFRSLPDEDLACLGFWLVFRKDGG